MFKTILLGTDGSPAAASAARWAIWFARKMQARILALHVTDIRILEGPLLADISGAVGAQPYPALLNQVREIQDARATTILEQTTALCRAAGVECDVVHETGGLTSTVLEYESRADLVVLGQRGEHAQFHPEMLGSSVEGIVRASTKSCLVATESFREPKSLLIAHDGSAESARALQRGLELAVALEATVTVVTACQNDTAEGAAKTLQAAHELAVARGLQTQAQLVHENPENAILKIADESKADLIVMGAYGHTRIREWILGSTTTQVLRKTRVPVFLSRGIKE